MRYVFAVFSIGALAALAGCDDFGDFGHVEQDFHYTYAMQPGGHLDVENRNGSISIVGWDRDSIDVSGTKYAPDDARLKDVQVKVDVSGNMASIVTETPGGEWGNFGANYTIHVPRNTLASRIKSTNGSVSAEDMTAAGSLLSTNGGITLRRDNGNFDVRTTNGNIEFEECNGLERAETTNGAVKGSLNTGALDARSTNGSIEVTITKPQPDESIRAHTTNGGIRIELDAFAGNGMRLETSHGPITVRLPRNVDATIDAHTSLAHITSDIPVAAEESDKHELRGQIGKGGPVISAVTSTGPIHFEDAGR